MADGKKKIIVYADWIDSFEELSDEEAGKLIKHFFRYVNDQEPVLEDRILKAHWIHIQNTLKRDLDKWKNYVEKQKGNGELGGRPNVINDIFSFTGKKVPVVSNNHFVYLIYDKVEDEFKIGETSNLIKRRYTIKRPTNNLVIWDFAELDRRTCINMEKLIKATYDHYGDWLKINKDQVDEIVTMFREKTQAFINIAKKAVSVSDSVSDSVKERDVQGPSLENSNLFRKPDIPTFEQVNEAFGMQGGTQDMARKFFEKHDATGWYINNSPIKNFASLIPKFIENWNRNNARDRNNTKSKLGAKSGGFGILNEVERKIGLLGPEDD